MPCYHPLRAWEHPQSKTEKGKSQIFFHEPNNALATGWNEIQLPCGQCIGCRMDYAKEWATRCILEAKEWEHNYFVTLTYSPEHVPRRPKLNIDTNEIVEPLTLDKRDLQLFMKRLRENYRRDFKHTNIRLYGCGEYGENTERPHYHLILFNLPIPDLVPFFINHEGQQVYRSAYIEKTWGLGIVSVGEVTYQSAAYVARYILKKQTGQAQRKDREPEFTVMSRRPGIASKYFETHSDDIYKNDEIIISARLGKAVAMKPPRYFDDLYDLEEPERLKDIKLARREKALDTRSYIAGATTLDMRDYMGVQERSKAQKVSMLKRKMREDV